jgi:transcription termination factor Rho
MRKRFKHKFGNQQQQQPHGQHAGGQHGLGQPQAKLPPRVQGQLDLVPVDVAGLPADLTEAEYEELNDSIPSLGRKKAPEATQYADLQAKNLAELIEQGDEEDVDLSSMRVRRDAIWSLAQARMLKRVPVIAEGVFAFHQGHAFLRSSENDYLPAADDVFVPPSLAERFALRAGMTVRGRLRPAREGERYLCLHELQTIDFHPPEEARGRAPFKELVPLYPEQRILLEGAPSNPLEMRIVDLVTPIGRGQRGLIVAPPRTGKTVLLQMLANSIVANAPDAHLIILLVDERPEEVTDFERSIPRGKREIVASTFDEPASRHLHVAEMVMHKAKSLVEAGEHVVILLDSITRLARAANVEAPSNGKLLSGGMEASALQFPKKFFGAARNIENGGSLTILATALIDTGSKMDELIFEEFKGTGNMEIVLDRRLSDRRIYPAIDINRSGTRKEELLFTPDEIKRIWMLRKVLNEMDPVEAMEMLLQKMKKTRVNGEFLLTIG